MATDLMVYGPFDVDFEDRPGGKIITSKHGSAFWSMPKVSGLKAKQGCYVFAMRAGKGFKPWYVGKASKGFAGETFTDHKRNLYQEALSWGHKGTPVLFFVAPPDKKRKVPSNALSHMEKELIQFAAKKNPKLCNTHHRNNLPQWTIKGVIRAAPGKPNAREKKFSKMMNIREV